MKIITNNIPRKIIYGCELPEKYRKEFDYLSDEEYAINTFVVYRGNAYDLYEFMRIEDNVKSNVQFAEWNAWHGYASDTYFSGVLVRFIDDESVIIARYYS